MRVTKNLHKYIKRHRATETGTAFVAIIFGIILLHPDATFSLPGYESLKQASPEWFWGVSALLIGVFQLVGMVHRKFYLRSLSLLLSIGYWIFTSLMLLRGDIIMPEVGCYLVVAGMNAFAYVQTLLEKEGLK